jgi:hypothetical protein
MKGFCRDFEMSPLLVSQEMSPCKILRESDMGQHRLGEHWVTQR